MSDKFAKWDDFYNNFWKPSIKKKNALPAYKTKRLNEEKKKINQGRRRVSKFR